MIQILLCDDNQKYRDKLSNLIYKYMEDSKLTFEVLTFDDYDSRFENYLNQNHSKKVYFLDIEAPSQSGIDVARKIREKDLNSIIIIVTGHDDMANTIINNDLYILAYINKFDNLEKKVANAIERVIKINNYQPSLNFTENHTNYSIAYKDIVYITRDAIERKCIIITDHSEHRTFKSISEIAEMLPNNFKQTHRSCIVNLDRVNEYNTKSKIIEFDNGTQIDLVSSKYCKDNSKTTSGVS